MSATNPGLPAPPSAGSHTPPERPSPGATATRNWTARSGTMPSPTSSRGLAPSNRRATEPVRVDPESTRNARPTTRRETPRARRQPRRTHPVLFVLAGPQQGAVFTLGRETRIGRDEQTETRLHDPSISREHARILRHDDGVFVEDLESRNGTFIGEYRVQGLERLEDGDYIRFGRNTVAKFAMVDELEERALTMLYDSTLRDPLTRLYNRRYFDERLYSEYSFSRRHGAPLALLLLDLDHFKRVNDVHGHPAGDLVLRLVAATVQRMMRPEDVVVRFGGEELVVIARGTDLRNGEILAERIRRRIEGTTIDWDGRPLRVTISIGVTAVDRESHFHSADAMMSATDEALYEAKRRGRNCVVTREAPIRTSSLAPQDLTVSVPRRLSEIP